MQFHSSVLFSRILNLKKSMKEKILLMRVDSWLTYSTNILAILAKWREYIQNILGQSQEFINENTFKYLWDSTDHPTSILLLGLTEDPNI